MKELTLHEQMVTYDTLVIREHEIEEKLKVITHPKLIKMYKGELDTIKVVLTKIMSKELSNYAPPVEAQ